MKIADVERYRSKVVLSIDGCWLWSGSMFSTGYGAFKVERKQRLAHRVAYELEHGTIPAGLTIDHLCRVRACVNPAHLEAVTQRENTLRSDGLSARNARKTHCLRGHKFTPENTRTYRGLRVCRACHREYQRAWRRRCA